jgi:hypothetical protein
MVLRGRTRVDVAEAVGVNSRFVEERSRTYEAQGSIALDGGARGRRRAEQKALNRHQEAMIRRIIGNKCPDHAIVLSIDEKSQIQALDRTQ